MAQVLEQLGAGERAATGIVEGLLEDWGWADARLKTGRWDFTDVKELVLWCNGPTSGQSPRAIRGLLEAGYPGEKLKYYRGGMQMWQLWGLTTIVPQSGS